MNAVKLIRQMSTFLLAVLILVACGAAPSGQVSTAGTQPPVVASATSSLTEVPTPIPPTIAPTSAPTVAPEALIETDLGSLIITKVETAGEDFMGNKPQPGYQILLVWLESPDGKVSGIDLFDMRKGVYVIADDGSRTESYGGGMTAGDLVVGFTPPDTAHSFTLYWPDNAPIELEK